MIRTRLSAVLRFLTLVLLAAVVFVGGCVLVRILAPDEVKIRWLIEDAAEAYDAGKPKSTLTDLSETWFDRESGLHKDTLHQILVYHMWTDKDDEGFVGSVVIPEESLMIEVGDDDTATARLEARFFRRTHGEPVLRWRIEVEAELAELEDGWKIVGSTHRTLEGEP